MAKLLAGLMIVLGVSAIVIGVSVFLYSAANTGHVAELLFGIATGSNHPFTGAYNATVESELRFYAPFWITYGAILIMTARRLSSLLHRVPILSAVFFAGGVGRLLAFITVGPPHPAFTGLMVIELVLPLVFMALWASLRTQGRR